VRTAGLDDSAQGRSDELCNFGARRTRACSGPTREVLSAHFTVGRSGVASGAGLRLGLVTWGLPCAARGFAGLPELVMGTVLEPLELISVSAVGVVAVFPC
jgi:hypothetical protein